MRETKAGSKKAGRYALIFLGIVSMIVCVLFIVGGIFIQLQITSGVNNIYSQVEKTYQATDSTVSRAQSFVSNVETDFNKVAPLISVLTDADKKKVTDAIDSINGRVGDIQNFLDGAKNNVVQTNEKIDAVNSLGIVELPKLSGGRIESASEKVNEFSNDLDTLRVDISNNAAKQSVVDKVNMGIDNVQKSLTGYRAKIGDAKQDAKDFKDLVIFWSTLGTIFIVGFFIWSIYSFCYLTKGQVNKLKELKHVLNSGEK